MADLVPGSPWSEVVHIEDRSVNQRGGCYWVLTLACGHIAVRRRRQVRMTDILSEHRIGFAPRRVRCYTCGSRRVEAVEINSAPLPTRGPAT